MLKLAAIYQILKTGEVLLTPGVLHPMVEFKTHHLSVLYLVNKNKITTINPTIGCNTPGVGKNLL